MIPIVLLNFVDLFVFIFNALIIVRVIASYVMRPEGGFYQSLAGLTEPVLAPIRRVLPQTPGFDMAPMVAFLLLQGLDYVVRVALAQG